MAKLYDIDEIMPTVDDITKIVKAKIAYEAAQGTAERDSWNKTNFTKTPWGISYMVCQAKYEKSKNKSTTSEPTNIALRYFIIAIFLEWSDLITQLKRTLKNWGYTQDDMQYFAKLWSDKKAVATINNSFRLIDLEADKVDEQLASKAITEAIEKHDKLNSKLFTNDEVLKDKVKDKLLEIVDEFLNDLKDQKVEIKVDDILLVGSNANYNYTKDSDIDLHIIANTKKSKYDEELSNALYGAYRTLFNKRLDIQIYDIKVELYVETENSPRNSNGVYSVKKNKWVKKPVHEEIPEYDKDALNKLVDKWENKIKDLEIKLKADSLKDEKKVLDLLEKIYDSRKKGVAKSEYDIDNLAFKELRNKGYLDKLKDYRNELTSKRLSLEERLDRQTRINCIDQIRRAAIGNQPIIQDNGMFYIYNLKDSDVNMIVANLHKLPFIKSVSANTSGKYDFSNTAHLAMNGMPKQYYNIRGIFDETLI